MHVYQIGENTASKCENSFKYLDTKVISYDDLTTYGWQSACHVEFNPEGSMLMVSGILMGDISGRIKGEIIVFTLKNQKLRICARISNRVSVFVENQALVTHYRFIRQKNFSDPVMFYITIPQVKYKRPTQGLSWEFETAGANH